MRLAASLCTWDWDDPDYIINLGRKADGLWHALIVIAEMAGAK